ncbi:peptidoglycan DD-metalloendopeptidase family protein [Streptomyces sp. NRRL S-237]|uniref:peptidoglycan DD-metalloendopeptidase family protein n=1 Tax=Streptomyces sp. NRRL S-237 TaxID=1463895 RepID=UPI000D116655
MSRRASVLILAAAAAAVLPAVVAPSTAAARTAGFAASCPTSGFISQYYSQAHNGIDIANDYGTPIHAVGDGEVTISGYEPGYGQWIRIRHVDGTVTEYGHMQQRDVAVGDHVVAGQRIALMGSEGQSSGPHLHLRVWADPNTSIRTDPVPYLAERGVEMPCTPGQGEVFASGPAGIFHRYQSAPNGGWSEWEPTGGGPALGRIEMEKAPDGRLEVFAVNGDSFQHQYQTAVNGGWSSWENFGGGGHDLTVDHNADGRLEVFASGPVGVFHKYQTGPAGWSEWEPAGGPADSQLTSDRTADGRVEVFAINGAVAMKTWQTGLNAPYSAWADFGGGGTEITATTNADGRIEVFGTSGAGVFHRWQTGFATWSEWAWVNNTAGPAVN